MKNSEGRFKVKEATSGSKMVWIVSGYKLNGQRVRKRFDTEMEALGEKHLLDVEAMEVESHKPKITRLTADQIAAAERAFAIIGEDKSILDAATFYRDNYRPGKVSIKLRDALPQYEEDKRGEGLREKSLQGNLSAVRKLPLDMKVDKITPERIEGALDRSSPSSFNTHRARIRGFFTWAIGKEYCSANPVDRIASIKIDDTDPEAYSVDQVKRLLRAARDTRDGALLPYMVLGLFAGIRPDEVQKLQWGDIYLDGKESVVTISGRVAKKRSRRTVELSENAVEWLSTCKGTPILPKAFRDAMQETRIVAGFSVDKHRAEWLRRKYGVKEDAELDPWIHDGLRHTAISMHYAVHGDKKMTAFWAGNSPDIIDTHYRALVRKPEATAFWAITPDNVDDDNVTDIKEASA